MIRAKNNRPAAGSEVTHQAAVSLRKNFSWTFLGNAVYALSQWVLLVLLARLGNTVEVGQFSLALAVSAPVVLFSNLKLRSVQASDALDEYRFGTYLSLRIVTSLLSVVVIATFVWTLGYRGTLAGVILTVATAKVFESISDIFYGLQQRHEHMDVIAHSLVFKSVVTVLGFAAGYAFVGSLVAAVIGLAVAWALVLLAYDVPRAAALVGFDGIRPTWSRINLQRLAWLALPLGITVALGSLSTNVPKYFIEAWLSTEELGIFAALSYVMVAGSMIINAIGQSATPRLANLYRRGNRPQHYRLTLKLLALGGGVGIVGLIAVALLGEEVLRVLYGPEYAQYQVLFLWIMANAAITYAYVFMGTALTSMKKFGVQLPINISGLLVLCASCWILIPRFGLNAAAWSMLIANLWQILCYSAVFAKEIRPGVATSDEKELVK